MSDGRNVKIKICGLKDPATALEAAAAGADAVGFVFARGARQVQRQVVKSICDQLPPFLSRVGVFVDAPIDQVNETVDYCGLDTIQLHGNESPEYCRSFKIKVIKAFRIRDHSSLKGVRDYSCCSAVLLDTWAGDREGGTGLVFDWRLAREFTSGSPVILAGGLTPENVKRAIKMINPYAVDVSSGVETGGQKDVEKIRLFIKNIRGGEPE